MSELNKKKELLAAYLCIKESVADDLESCTEFKHALQYAGFNPTAAFLEKLWKDGETERITFLEFCEITTELNLASEEYLKKLISSVFIVNNDKISIKDLRSLLMISKRKKVVCDNDIDSLISEIGSENGFVKVSSICKILCQTVSSLKKYSICLLEEKAHDQRIYSKTYTKQLLRRRSLEKEELSGASALSFIDQWFSSSLKGVFFLDKDSIISHQYSLEVPCIGPTCLKIKPVKYNSTTTTVDTLAYIFRETMDGTRSYIGYTNFYDQDGSNYWMDTLKEGKYVIIPYVSGLQLRNDKPCSSISDIKLIDATDNIKLTEDCLKILEEIFNQMDLDNSGFLNRQEFNLYNWRTSAEIVQDDEWDVVQSNFDVRDGELTLSGFTSLHQLEAEDNGGDSEELWLSLETIGYNRLGKQDQAAPYLLQVFCQVAMPSVLVSGLKSGGLLLDKALIRSIMDEAEPVPIGGKQDLLKYHYTGLRRAAIVIQNKSNDNVRVSVDCSQSINCLTNRSNLNWIVDIDKKSAIIVHQLMPIDHSKAWEVFCKETILDM